MSLIPDVTEGFLRCIQKLGYHPWLIGTQLHSLVEFWDRHELEDFGTERSFWYRPALLMINSQPRIVRSVHWSDYSSSESVVRRYMPTTIQVPLRLNHMIGIVIRSRHQLWPRLCTKWGRCTMLTTLVTFTGGKALLWWYNSLRWISEVLSSKT